MELMAERLESLKAGAIGSVSLGLAFLSTSFINVLWLDKYFPLVSYDKIDIVNLQILLNGVIAGFSGFLFGVTYRYIIRTDSNSHLKEGAILAFGLVRGGGLAEMTDPLLDNGVFLAIALLEGIIGFAIARFCLDIALTRQWLKPFP